MDPQVTDTASQIDVNQIIKVLSILLKLASGSPFAIATALLSITAAFIFYMWKRNGRNKDAYRQSQETKEKEQAGGKVENTIVEHAAEQAEQSIEDIRKANPDTDKTERPTD